MEQKKPTNAELQRRMQQSPLFLKKTKETKTLFFDDKGLRLTVDDIEGYALIATNFHTHVFQKTTSSGISRPYLYTKRFIEIALENDCTAKDEKGDVSYSYSKLFETLKAKDNAAEFNTATYFDWWLLNIFSPLFTIGESEIESFLVYETYLRNIAKNHVILSEKSEDMTQRQFIEKVNELEKSFTDGLEESVLFKKLTDDERMQQEIEALQQDENEKIIEKQQNGIKDGE